ncbi:serine/threonine protein kinase [Actinomadura rudentiformis]|uniref:Serine/threonine protein kinase n=2 Tax=Actinomadura rudentiformis TaxID=359158 RepID=A0A6H9YFD1_9ACTN|nr:serine/threonine protein kinase [Actinomadura rudentiformis]
MADFQETRRDPGVTGRDPGVPGPRPGETRRDQPGRPGGPLMRLPAGLAEHFELVAELPVQGAESDLLLVRDALGAEHVVKVFRRGYNADREVWAKLPGLESPNVVRILETGHADGRDYEVTAYAPDGNLRGLMAGPLPAEAVTRIVGQLSAGLAALHRVGIVHRDLKPENVLIMSADPLQVAITDFGLSKVLDQSVVFASSSRTLAYAAPESLSGQVSPARDWWSLGMIVRELLTGRPPFMGLSETAVVDHLATRPVPADEVPDPRFRLLCQGLLTRDPRRRWTDSEVTEWLNGGAPPVAPEAAHPMAPEGAGLPFNGQRYTERAELARALIEKWDYAALYFFGRGESGEAWRTLREWLSEFDDSRIGLIDGYLTTGLAPDVKLLHLVRWLDPTLPPHFLGRRVTSEDLPGLAALAKDPSHSDHRAACLLGRELWDQHLLQVLSGFEGGRDLTRIDEQWRSHVASWNRLAGWLREHESTPPRLASRLPDAGSVTDERIAGRAAAVADDPPVVLLTLLALAAWPAETRRSLADAAERARAAVPEQVPWFTWLVEGAGDDPLRLLAVVRAAPEAVVDAEARARGRHAAQQEAQALRARWDEKERARLAGRGVAVARAVAWSLPLLAFWLLGSWIVGAVFGGDGDGGTKSVGGVQQSSGVPFAVLAVLSLIAWAVQCGSEVVLARAQGRDYLPYGPWSWMSRLLGVGGRGLSKASQTLSGAAQRTGRRGCGLLLLAGTVPLLIILLLLAAVTPVASLLWLMVLLAAPVAHAVAAGVRLHRWRQALEGERQKALQDGVERR